MSVLPELPALAFLAGVAFGLALSLMLVAGWRLVRRGRQTEAGIPADSGVTELPHGRLERLYELSVRFADNRQELDLILDRAPFPAITLDVTGTVTTWNLAAQDVLGWRASDVIGRKLALETPILGPVWEVLEPNARRTTEVLDLEIEVLDRRGRPRLGSLTMVPAADPEWQSLVLTLRPAS